MTPVTALWPARFFGVSPTFWLNLQLRWDLYLAQQSEAHELGSGPTRVFPTDPLD